MGRCERVLRRLGFRVYRVRYHGELARIEVGRDEIVRLLDADAHDTVLREFQAAGFVYVAVDLQGYRMGSLNEAVTTRRSPEVTAV